MRPAVIIHGGAEAIPEEQREAFRRGLGQAVEAGWEVLEAGGSAVDAVEAAVRVMEAAPVFNAGRGSMLNADGEVEMDAGLMEGEGLNVGAVGAIQGVRHPVSVARALLYEEPILLVSDGARRFAQERHAELCDPEALITFERLREWEQKQRTNNTVGCVALDREGHLAAGVSTGGTGDNPKGRLGDSPLPGCGFYADDRLGGTALTGDGEQIARVVLARTAVEFLRQHAPEEAAVMALQVLGRVGGEAGIIVLDTQGRVGWAHNSPNMACAYRTAAMAAPKVYLSKQEEAADAQAQA
ncbi:isoaspartyl peptidase/L-asparaginase family protein [Calidithermus chliarophilus]|uniref:isoaspartyl peptidase/L-asparaginase family protein n=1 Tax=Calidithermus chliarophilus TaxID=52023 RepID=UPI0003FA6E51|nr:isoaspartyl peptidase/L-asparaginase family protein [Calidithermus chliarophilus]